MAPSRVPLGSLGIAAGTVALLLACASADRVAAPSPAPRADVASGALVVVSQVYGGGGNSGATFKNDYIELYNPGTTAVSVAGWSVQYASASGMSWQVTPLSGSIAPGRYYLVQQAAGAAGTTDLPTPDAVGSIAMSGTGAKVALVNTTTALTGSCPLANAVDFVGYGSANCFEGSNPTLATSNTTAAIRNAGGNDDDNDNRGDFTIGAPTPRNSGGAGPAPVGPLASVTVTPASASVDVGASVTLAAVAEDAEGDDISGGTVTWTDEGSPNVTVTPSANGRTASVRGDAVGGPVRVIASLTADGVTRADTALVTVTTPRPPGSTARISFSGFNSAPLPPGYEDQIFARAFSSNSNADSLPNVAITLTALTPQFATIDANGVVRGVGDGRALFEALTSDGFRDTAFVVVQTPQDPTTAAYANHVEFGQPTDATPGDEFVVQYPEFVASYNAERGQPNWIAYNLEATHRGPAERCDCFSPDTTLPAGFRRVSTNDYTGSGYTRGHMVMSEDRTTGPNPPQTSVDNARTFLFTNIVPQLAANNSGPWLDLEIYLGGLATSGTKEIYIYAGGTRYQGTLKGEGNVAIPSRTWKVAIILERNRGLGAARTASDVQVIAVDMPNLPADAAGLQSRPWTDFRVSVDSVERLTGYDFLAALPDGLEAQVEASAATPRPVGIDVQPERISLASTPAVTVVLYSGADFNAVTAAAPADLRLVVDGGAAVAPVTRGGTVNTSTRDVDGDGRLDRVISFSTSALRAAGLSAGSSLTLVPTGAAPAFRGADATPPVVAP